MIKKGNCFPVFNTKIRGSDVYFFIPSLKNHSKEQQITMKETEKLIQILTKFGPHKLPILEISGANNGKLENRLYENIKAGKYKSEKEALLDLYETEEDYNRYRMLKSRLKQKLFNQLYFTED